MYLWLRVCSLRHATQGARSVIFAFALCVVEYVLPHLYSLLLLILPFSPPSPHPPPLPLPFPLAALSFLSAFAHQSLILLYKFRIKKGSAMLFDKSPNVLSTSFQTIKEEMQKIKACVQENGTRRDECARGQVRK